MEIYKIKELIYKYEKFSEESLKEQFQEWKNEKEINELKFIAFLAVIINKTLLKKPYDSQLFGAYFLIKNNIIEMKTGEGKTLVSLFPIIYNVLLKQKTHIVTTNSYLAERDFYLNKPIFDFLNIKVGFLNEFVPTEDRREIYQKEVVYGTINDFGFDYLKDNLVYNIEDKVQQNLDYVLIDEIDAILIDEARTPLILSSSCNETNIEIFKEINNIVKEFSIDQDYTIDSKNPKNIIPTEKAITIIENKINIKNIYTEKNLPFYNMVIQSLKANFIYKNNQDYIVKNNLLYLVDCFTGRILEGRKLSYGLHQAIQIKEGLEIDKETDIFASISIQNYFKLYKKFTGMTGTAFSARKEFKEIYNLDVKEISPNKPLNRKDNLDLLFKTIEEKDEAILDRIKKCYYRGQPILIFTSTIENSVKYSNLLELLLIPHSVLNAKNDKLEADIIAKAGNFKSVTIATNMAGRGTDIIVDEQSLALGGLFILGTEKNESERIDNQIKGRTSRQGEIGETQFILSLEDDFFKCLGNETFIKTLKSIDTKDLSNNKLTTKIIHNCQKRIENHYYEIRKSLYKYDNILNMQRSFIYKKRDSILNSKFYELEKIIIDIIKEKTNHILKETQDINQILIKTNNIFSSPDLILPEDISNLKRKEIEDFIVLKAHQVFKLKKEIITEKVFLPLLKRIYLMTLDREWKNYLLKFEMIKDGIHLRAIGQMNPLIEFNKETYLIFKDLNKIIDYDFLDSVYEIKIQYN